MLSILGFIAVFIATYYVYKTAKDTNRNAAGWALLTLAIEFGSQIIFPAIVVIIIATAMAISGKPLNNIDQLPWSVGTIIGLSGLVVSFVGIWLIMRRVSILPDDVNYAPAPPSPPTFG
jgi:chromate transport protein ChrA